MKEASERSYKFTQSVQSQLNRLLKDIENERREKRRDRDYAKSQKGRKSHRKN